MFTWDDKKNAANAAKHGLRFEEIHEFKWEAAVYQNDGRRDYGESRYRAFGPLNGKMHIVVFTIREDSTRIISLRRANKREETLYEALKKS